MIGLIFVTVLFSGLRYKHHLIATALLAFFGVICLSVVTSFWPDEALNLLWEYFKLMVLFFVILLSVRDERDFRLTIAFLAIRAFMSGNRWNSFMEGTYRMGFEAQLPDHDPNSFASTIISFLCMYLWKTKLR
jgi:hypothetical protein